MAQQTAIQDILLSNASSAYRPEGFIAEELLPELQNKEKSGKFGTQSFNHLRIENTIIGGEGKYPRVQSTVYSTSQFLIEGHGLTDIVTEDDYSNVQLPFDAELDKTNGITDVLQIGKEKALADALSATGTMTQNVTLSGQSQFSDYNNSTPVTRFNTARSAVKAGCGLPPDTVIIPWEVKNVLKYHPQLLDVLGYKQNRPGGLTLQELADVFEVKRILCPTASYNSAKQGQTAVLSPIWGKNIIFGVFPTVAARRQVSVGYLMTLAGRAKRRVFKTPTSNPPNGKEILVDDHYDMFLTNVLAGYLIKDAIA